MVMGIHQAATSRGELRQSLANAHSDLQARYELCQCTIQDQAEKLVSQSSALEQREAELLYANSRLDALKTLQQQHLQFAEQTQSALDVSSSLLQEITTKWEISTQRIGELENDLTGAKFKLELEVRTAEASAAAARLAQVERAWARSREEANGMRSLTTQSSEQTQQTLSETRRQLVDFEKERSSLKAQVLGLRSQLSGAGAHTEKLRQELLISHEPPRVP